MGRATNSDVSVTDGSLRLADMLQLRYLKPRVPAKTLKEAPSYGSKPSSEELRHDSSPSSMTCSRPDPARAPDLGFDPKKLLGFLHDAAVSVLAAIKEPARALRLSAQVYRYRHFVSLCRTSEIDEGFQPERLLGFVLGIAVSFGDGGGESAEVGSQVAQLDSYRRFVSVQPRWSWSYEQDLEVEDDDGSQGSDQEISGSSSTSEEAYGVMDEFEDDDISNTSQEEVFEHKMQDDRVICVTNREDFSLLDEDYDSTSAFEAVEHRCRSSWEDSFGGENVKIKSRESEIGAYVEDHAEANETEFLVNEKSIGHFPSHVANDLCENIADLCRHEVVVKSEINVALDRYSEKTTETSRLEQDDSFAYVGRSIPVPEDKSLVAPAPFEEILPKSISCDIFKSDVSFSAIGSNDAPKEASQGLLVEKIMLGQSVLADIEHNNIDSSLTQKNNIDSSIIAIQSARNCLPSSPSIGQLLRDPANDSELTSSNGMLSSQHCTEDNIHFSSEDSNRGENSNKASDSVNCNVTLLSRSNAYATHEKTRTSHDKKRKISCSDILRHSSKSDKERISYHSGDISKWRRLYAAPLTRDESKSPSLCNGRKEEITTMNTDSSSTLPVQSARIISRTNGGSHHLAADHFNGHRVYASASTTDRFSDMPKSLHMKFPRNFNLPSKQALVKKFQVFGQLDQLRTKVSTFTGAAQVVFLHESDACAAYKYVKRKSVFGCVNVRFWFDEHENFRKGNRAVAATKAPSVNLKSCLKRPETDKKAKCKVRFSIEK